MSKKTSLMLQWSRVTLGFLVLGGFLGAADIGQAQGVTVPNTFVNGEVADATEINANFAAIESAIETASTANASAVAAAGSSACAAVGGTWDGSVCTPAAINGLLNSLPAGSSIANNYFVGPHADLTDANLSGADLTNSNLFGANLTGASYDAATVFPAGFDPASEGMILIP